MSSSNAFHTHVRTSEAPELSSSQTIAPETFQSLARPGLGSFGKLPLEIRAEIFSMAAHPTMEVSSTGALHVYTSRGATRTLRFVSSAIRSELDTFVLTAPNIQTRLVFTDPWAWKNYMGKQSEFNLTKVRDVWFVLFRERDPDSANDVKDSDKLQNVVKFLGNGEVNPLRVNPLRIKEDGWIGRCLRTYPDTGFVLYAVVEKWRAIFRTFDRHPTLTVEEVVIDLACGRKSHRDRTSEFRVKNLGRPTIRIRIRGCLDRRQIGDVQHWVLGMIGSKHTHKMVMRAEGWVYEEIDNRQGATSA
ncbi:MAG: hypothetical protein M1827_006587 [Pycnora praestabilis]|nr:MAG: hypothetical protein M1827_006587 [Pycnora praestabilis]